MPARPFNWAMFILASTASTPKSVKKSDAIMWYTKAAEAGEAEAQYILGMLYLNGNGVPADLTAAADWIEKAAHNDHAASQFQLGVMYSTGQGVPKDLPQAIAWYELAAQLGHPPAQYNLAVMLAKGQGCEPDRAAPFLDQSLFPYRAIRLREIGQLTSRPGELNDVHAGVV